MQPEPSQKPVTAQAKENPGFVCRICGGSSLVPFYTQGNQGECKFYRCRDCKLVNYDLSGGLDQGKYEQKYEDPMDDDNRFNHPQSATFKFLKSHLPPQGKLLEIGCGNGRLLHLANQAGWSVSGLELSSFMAQSVTERLNLPVLVSNIDAPDLVDRLTEKPYDLILLRHVLEHLPEPISVLKLLHSLLADRGHVLMEFPNIDGIDLKFKRLTRKLGLSHKKYPPDYHPGHCNEYCREAYQALIDRTGFELIAWETYSLKPSQNLLYTRWHIGNKARALIRKK